MAYDYLVWEVAVAAIVIGLAAVAYMRREGFKRPDQLQTLGMTLVILGIIFGTDDRLIGYSFIGAGVLLSVASLVLRRPQTRP